MERLTKRDKEGAYFPPCFEEPCLGGGCADDNCDFFNKVCQHLAELEDEEERREKGCYWCKEQNDEFGDTHMTASEITVVSRDRFGQRKLPRTSAPFADAGSRRIFHTMQFSKNEVSRETLKTKEAH